jgi:hypothetical protein
MLKRIKRPGHSLAALLLALSLGALPAQADTMDVNPGARSHDQSEIMHLAQVGAQVQSTCLSACSKRCDADYKACSLNGKAPRLVLDQTCSPHATTCNNQCTASCTK